MELEQIVLIQESFEQILPQAEATAQQFYARLFELDPTLRPLFPTDMQSQHHKLMAMFREIVHSLWMPETLAPELRDSGKRHVRYGARPEHYPLIGEALIFALRQQLGPRFTPEVEAAWSAAYVVIQRTMLAGAES